MLYFLCFIITLCKRHGVPEMATDENPSSMIRFDKDAILNLLRVKEDKKVCREDFRIFITKNPRWTSMGSSTSNEKGSKRILDICKGETCINRWLYSLHKGEVMNQIPTFPNHIVLVKMYRYVCSLYKAGRLISLSRQAINSL